MNLVRSRGDGDAASLVTFGVEFAFRGSTDDGGEVFSEGAVTGSAIVDSVARTRETVVTARMNTVKNMVVRFILPPFSENAIAKSWCREDVNVASNPHKISPPHPQPEYP
jgi:hypothetical protein